MSWFTKALRIDQVRHNIATFFALSLPRTKFNYAKEVGDSLDASVVMAPIQWVQRAFQEARFRVVRDEKDGGVTEIVDHPLTALIRTPNEFYSESALWSASVLSYLTAGNGYWQIARSANFRPVQLWYVPHWTIELQFPRDGTKFISNYIFQPGQGTKQRLEIEDVVHFRHGLDPRNIRLGVSPLRAVVREIFVDLEASNFSASLLKNMGIPGMMISPKNEQAMTPDEVAAVKKWVAEEFGGDRRGAPLVMGAPTNISEFGFSPDKMALGAVRDVAEERVCAALGIPVAVVGFGSGLQQTKVGATMGELRRLAWINGVIPILNTFAAEVGRTLLPDFGNAQGLRAEFDISAVLALQDDKKVLTERWDIMVRGGWATVADAKRALGQEVFPADEIYLRSFSTLEVPVGSPPRLLAPVESGTAALGGGETKQASATERRAGLAFVTALERMTDSQAKAMQGRLAKLFDAIGAAAFAARGLLPSFEEAGADRAEAKAAGDDALILRILAKLGLTDLTADLKQIYETHYLEVAGDVAKAGDIVGLATNLPDIVARNVVKAGGKRAGLIDLTAQTREALFDALAEGRAEGLGTQALARRVEGNVSAGPWRSSKIRSRVIARTETRFAQNVSTIARAQEAGVEKFIVHDGRLGRDVAANDGSGAPELPDNHFDRDGAIVTAAVAANMRDAEHPNGTLSFSPFFGDDDD